jgi:hypothetical protein
MGKKSYFVQQQDSNTLAVYDVYTGNRVQYIGLQGWTLDSTPIITGDRCSYMVKQGMRRRGVIVKLPSGNLITYFSS